MDEYFVIGRGTDSAGVPLFIAMLYPNPNEPHIIVQADCGPRSESFDLAVNEALQYRPRSAQFANVDGVARFVGVVLEPPGWFERKCAEANCEWFVPFVKGMAAGDNVPFSEIEAAYLTHNGKPLPHGPFTEVMR